MFLCFFAFFLSRFCLSLCALACARFFSGSFLRGVCGRVCVLVSALACACGPAFSGCGVDFATLRVRSPSYFHLSRPFPPHLRIMSEDPSAQAKAAAEQAKADAAMMRKAAEDPTEIHTVLDAEFEKKNYLKVHQKLTCVLFYVVQKKLIAWLLIGSGGTIWLPGHVCVKLWKKSDFAFLCCFAGLCVCVCACVCGMDVVGADSTPARFSSSTPTWRLGGASRACATCCR